MLVDAPPLLGIADTPGARPPLHDSLLYVARLDRLTLDNVIDARDMLDRLDTEPSASSSIGARERGVAVLPRPAARRALEDA